MTLRTLLARSLSSAIIVAAATACDSDSTSTGQPTSAELQGSRHPALAETAVSSAPTGAHNHSPHGSMPAGHPPVDAGSAVAVGAEAPAVAAGAELVVAGMVAQPPAEWVPETPASRMRAAQYRLPHAEGDEFDGELTVIAIPGGDLEGNIRRWQGEFQDRPEPKVDSKAVNGIEVTVVDLRGTFLYKPSPMAQETEPREGYRVLVAAARAPEQQVFFKAFGPAATINRWEPAFYEMVESFRPTR